MVGLVAGLGAWRHIALGAGPRLRHTVTLRCRYPSGDFENITTLLSWAMLHTWDRGYLCETESREEARGSAPTCPQPCCMLAAGKKQSHLFHLPDNLPGRCCYCPRLQRGKLRLCVAEPLAQAGLPTSKLNLPRKSQAGTQPRPGDVHLILSVLVAQKQPLVNSGIEKKKVHSPDLPFEKI